MAAQLPDGDGAETTGVNGTVAAVAGPEEEGEAAFSLRGAEMDGAAEPAGGEGAVAAAAAAAGEEASRLAMACEPNSD